MIENWISVKEAAQLAKMSPQALYAAIREKQFPAVHIGRRIRIYPDVVHEWAKRGGGKVDGDNEQSEGQWTR